MYNRYTKIQIRIDYPDCGSVHDLLRLSTYRQNVPKVEGMKSRLRCVKM